MKYIHSFFTMPNFLKFFGFGFFVYFIALFGLFRADVFYIDDFGRVIYGDNWNNFSRYVATFLQRYAQLKAGLADIAPLYQMLGICTLVLSSMWLIYALLGKVSYLSILALTPLGLSPYFLENLSYRYEAFLMSCAICFAIIPFGFRANKIAFFIISFICSLLLFGTYQAANSVYVLLGFFIIMFGIFIERKNVGEILRFAIAWISSFVLAALVYKKKYVTAVDSYVSTDMLSLSEIAGGGGVSNLLNYLSLLYNDFTHPRFYIFYIVMWICAMFVLCFVRGGRFRASAQDSAFYGFRGYVLRFVGAILFLGIGLVLSYGAYLVLKKPLFEPRAFNGIGFLVALMCLSFLLLESKKSMFDRIFKYICTGLIVLFTYGLIVFANAYADALSAQSRYTDFRAQKLLDDLMRAVPLDSNMLNVATLESRLDSKSITPVRYKLQGNIGYAPAAMYSISRFGNILRRLLPIHLNGEWYHGAMMFSNLKSSYTYDAYTPGTKVCENLDGKEKILLSQNVYQAIYKVDECVLVELYEGFEYKRW